MKSYLRNSDEPSEILPPSTESSIKLECLKTAQAIFSKDLTDNEIKEWKGFLDCYGDREIEYAFSSWIRNAKFFPKPGNITELIAAYRDVARPVYKLPYQRSGFGELQVKALWKLVNERYEKMTGKKGIKRGDHSKYVPLTDDEITEMCRKVQP